ncbi:MAG: prenyltransferase/squalene oxidase repeat-containing protein [Solibacillus sp.]
MTMKRFIIAFFMLIPLPLLSWQSAYAEEVALTETIEDIIEWKKQSLAIPKTEPLLSKPFLQNAGETMGDWYPIGLGRIGYDDDYAAYLAVVQNNVVERYKTEYKLSEMKATEWHRISLAILAAGGDPTNVSGIDLIADGTYNRGLTISLGTQGLNGWIWGLITLDSMRYAVPGNAQLTRKELIIEILSAQLADGGFSFYHDKADPDITGMAIQALAPYYNSTETFSYVQQATKQSVTKTVAAVIDEALQQLSTLQQNDGGFASWEENNVESAAQVLVALTALGIEPSADARFIKGGQTILDNILSYQMEDGGFIHSKTYNPENPSSLPDESNSMASEQVLYALISLYRLENDYRALYDFRPELDASQKQTIEVLREKIDALSASASSEQLQALLKQYNAIPDAEKSYVYNFSKLAALLEGQKIVLPSYPFTAFFNVTTSGNGAITPILHNQQQSAEITATDVEKVQAIPSELTTEYYIEVVSLLHHFENAENRQHYEKEIATLQQYKEAIEKIEHEINAINEEVLDKLYPFNELSIRDKEHVEAIMQRFNALSAYDQTKILSYEDLKKSKTQIHNLIRARIIAIALGTVAVLLVIIVVLRIKKRRAIEE